MNGRRVELTTWTPNVRRLSRKCRGFDVTQTYTVPRTVTGIALLTFAIVKRKMAGKCRRAVTVDVRDISVRRASATTPKHEVERVAVWPYSATLCKWISTVTGATGRVPLVQMQFGTVYLTHVYCNRVSFSRKIIL